MSALLRITAGLLLLLLLLPSIAREAAKAIPFVLSVLVFLVVAQLVWPSGRGRR
jgi:hypothetical protein